MQSQNFIAGKDASLESSEDERFAPAFQCLLAGCAKLHWSASKA